MISTNFAIWRSCQKRTRTEWKQSIEGPSFCWRSKLIDLANGLGVSRLLLHKRSDQAQQFLLFWPVASAQEGRKVLMFHVPTRGHIGFMMDEQNS